VKRLIAVLFALVLLSSAFVAPAAAAPNYTAPASWASAAKTVVITAAPGAVRRGAYASVSIKAWSGASCSIGVYYKSGRSVAKGLYAKKAAASGRLSWTWKVGTNTTRGSWPVAITCGGVTARTVVTVR
jgi:hypothetical protein